MRIRQAVLWGVFLLIVGQSILLIAQKENLLANGQVVHLELVPVDPRSLIQGDYMILRYSISDDTASVNHPEKGLIVIGLDTDNIARFVRIYDPDHPLEGREFLLGYYSQGPQVRIGPTAFFFQEGDAKYYDNAKYAELRVSDDGESMLVGLRGDDLERLGPTDN